MSGAALGAPWSCADVGSFAWRTCTQRWPRIVDALREDVPAADAALAALRDEIKEDRAVVYDVDAADADRFAVVAAHAAAGRRWTALPWYVGEAFVYARVRRAVGYARNGADPFLPIKQREEAGLAASDPADVDEALWRALWGNRADLSLPSAKDHVAVSADDLVVDDRVAAAAAVETAGVVGVVLDNAGLELARDLALARLLTRQGKRVIVFAKDVPFFVSDALPADVERTRSLLGIDDGATVIAHPFFTGPEFLRTPRMPAAVADALAGCDVVVVKGDCNYRRLVGDTPPHDGAFADVVDFPAPLLALRTLKAEVLVGGDPARVAAAKRRDPDWLVSGRFGLVQLRR